MKNKKPNKVPLIAERALGGLSLFSAAVTEYLTLDNLEREAVCFE